MPPRFVTFYGAPQLGATIIGRKSPNRASKKLRRQARPYAARSEKPIIRGFDLIATIATPCSGSRDKCRTHQQRSVIKRYLTEARQLNGRLILDIQPGRASVKSEIGHWRRYVKRPDVDIAIDPEWNVGKNEEPGEDQGSITARELNRCSAKMQRLIDEKNLPDKMMVVYDGFSLFLPPRPELDVAGPGDGPQAKARLHHVPVAAPPGKRRHSGR